MDITKLTITELKAMVYDELIKLENCQNNIKTLNEEIKKRGEEKKTEDNLPK